MNQDTQTQTKYIHSWYEYENLYYFVYISKLNKLMSLKEYANGHVVRTVPFDGNLIEKQICAELSVKDIDFIRYNLVGIESISSTNNIVNVSYNIQNKSLGKLVSNASTLKELLKYTTTYVKFNIADITTPNVYRIRVTDNVIFELDTFFDQKLIEKYKAITQHSIKSNKIESKPKAKQLDLNAVDDVIKIVEIPDEAEFAKFHEHEKLRIDRIKQKTAITEKEKIAKSTKPKNVIKSKKTALREMILSSIKSKSILYTKDITEKDITPDINGTTVVFAKNGVFEIVKTRVGIFSVQVNQLNIPQKDLVDFEQEDKWFIPKPTLSDLMKLVEIDKYIYSKTQAEFYANLMWNAIDKKYEIEIPTQAITGASVNFKPIVDTDYKFTVIDHHSHNVLSSFFSGVDDENDIVRFKLAIVIGNLNKGFTVASRKVVNGVFQSVEQSELFEEADLIETLNKIDKMFEADQIKSELINSHNDLWPTTSQIADMYESYGLK